MTKVLHKSTGMGMWHEVSLHPFIGEIRGYGITLG
jgi:hypothetical protein